MTDGDGGLAPDIAAGRAERDALEAPLQPHRVLGAIRPQLRRYDDNDQIVIVPFAATSDPDIVVQMEHGRPVRALGRRCPHQHALLDQFGAVEGGRITCKHHGYAWDCETGEVVEARTNVDSIRVGSVVLEGGEAVTDIDLPGDATEGQAQ